MGTRCAYYCIASIETNYTKVTGKRKTSIWCSTSLDTRPQGDGQTKMDGGRHTTACDRVAKSNRPKTDNRCPQRKKCCLQWVVRIVSAHHGHTQRIQLIDSLRNWLCSTFFRMQAKTESDSIQKQMFVCSKRLINTIWHKTTPSRINNTHWRPDYVDIFVYLLHATATGADYIFLFIFIRNSFVVRDALLRNNPSGHDILQFGEPTERITVYICV